MTEFEKMMLGGMVMIMRILIVGEPPEALREGFEDYRKHAYSKISGGGAAPKSPIIY